MAPIELGRLWPFRKKRQPLTSVVLLDGSAESLRALDIAFHAFMPKDSLKGVHVIKVDRKYKLDDDLGDDQRRGEEILTQAETVLRDQEVPVQPGDFRLLKGREKGPILVDEVTELIADRVFVGAKVDQMTHEISPTAEYVLKHAKSMVILVRPK